MKLYKLKKVVLSVNNNAAKFLDGLTSNTLEQKKNAFLDMHGKIVATFDQIKIADDRFLILIEDHYYEKLLLHLDKFMKLSKVEIKKEDYNVYFDLDGDYTLQNGELTLDERKGKLIITKTELKCDVNDQDFTQFRLKNNIPLHGEDYQNTLLLNVGEEFISFTKGCFLGQEPISKVHSRSQPAWKLIVKFEDECTDEEKAKLTSKTKDKESGKVFGFVFVRNK